MNDPIYNELSKKIKLPNINVDTIFISELDTSINRHCGTKQTIELTADEVKDILNEK